MSFDSEFARYQADFEAGDPTALHQAVLLAIWNNLPVPAWAAPGLEQIVIMHVEGRFKRRQGVAAPLAVADKHDLDRTIYEYVEWLLSIDKGSWQWHAGDRRQSKQAAFEVAAEYFHQLGVQHGDRGKIQTNLDTVRSTYFKVQRAIRAAKSGDAKQCKRSGDF